jgi:predicted phosphodiesterase
VSSDDLTMPLLLIGIIAYILPERCCQFTVNSVKRIFEIMRIVIFSDLHNLVVGFHTILLQAQRKNADRLLYLGDVGSDSKLFAALRAREIDCTFGNWEVSGLRRMPPQLAKWVSVWPAKIEIDDVCYTHATPDLPPSISDTASAVAYMAHGVGWSQLFPRLNNNEEARWAAFAALEMQNQRAAFHGHTHIQQVWIYEKQRWRCLNGPAEFTLEAGSTEHATRYLIGVGSAGDPQDGSALRYALYDDSDKSVQLLAVKPGA